MVHLTSLLYLAALAIASPLSPEAANLGNQAAPQVNAGKPSSEGKTTFDGVSLAAIQQKPSAAQVNAAAIDRTGWTATADSYQAENPPSNVLDGNTGTIWHTKFNPTVDQLPHQLTIDMKQSYLIGSVTYLPRQDNFANGNIGGHVVSVR